MNGPKLLLLSYSLSEQCLADFLGKSPAGLNVAFVPTAGTPYDDKTFVERERIIYREMGLNVKDVPLEGKQYEDLEPEFQGSDIVHISGGNTYYLLQEIRRSGLDRLLREILADGVPYVGSSAGSIVVGPDIEPVGELDDPSAAPGMTDFQGLNLVDFVVLPHYGDEKYEATYRSAVKKYEKKYKIILLRNDQAIKVIDNTETVISAV